MTRLKLLVFNTLILGMSHVPNTVIDSGDKVVNQLDKVPELLELIFRRTDGQ